MRNVLPLTFHRQDGFSWHRASRAAYRFASALAESFGEIVSPVAPAIARRLSLSRDRNDHTTPVCHQIHIWSLQSHCVNGMINGICKAVGHNIMLNLFAC